VSSPTPELPATMAAAVFNGAGRIDLEHRPVPTLGPHDVLVEVSHCGICGSDLHLGLDGWARPGSIGGHEFTGHVAAVGSEVADWTPGDPVVGGPPRSCGTCRSCRRGRPSLCVDRATPGKSEWQGAFARFVRVPRAQLLRLPPGLDLRTAALTEPLAVALHALTISGAQPGDRVAVFGLGPIGQLLVAALVERGVDDVVVVEPRRTRRTLGRALGATQVLEPEALEVPTIAEPERLADHPVDVAFECSGARAAMEAALAQLDRGGLLVLVGAGVDPPRLDPNRIVLNELRITGSYCYDPDGFPRALDLLASGRLPTHQLLEPVDLPLGELATGMRRLASGELAAKVLIAPGLGGHEHG